MHTRPVVYVPEDIGPDAIEALSADCTVVVGYGPEAVPFDEAAPTLEAVVLLGFPFPAGRIAACPRLRVIARAGVGYDAVDVEAATARGIPVTNTPGANASSVAELTIGLLISCFHRIPELAPVTDKRASRAFPGKELRDAVLAVVGAGDIGCEVARMAAALGMRPVLAVAPGSSEARIGRIRERASALGAEVMDLAEAAEICDALSVHTPLTPQTHHLVDADLLSRMKPDAVVLNTARGGVVDDAALFTAVQEGRLGGAGLDCTEVEPVPADHELRTLPNIVVLPHVGSLTHQTRRRVGLSAARAVLDALAGREPEHVVNREALEADQAPLASGYGRVTAFAESRPQGNTAVTPTVNV